MVEKLTSTCLDGTPTSSWPMARTRKKQCKLAGSEAVLSLSQRTMPAKSCQMSGPIEVAMLDGCPTKSGQHSVPSAIQQFLEDDNDVVPIGWKRHDMATLVLPSYNPRTSKDQRCSYATSTPACRQGSSRGHARIMCAHVEYLKMTGG